MATPQGALSFIQAPGSCTEKQENVLKRKRKIFYPGVLVLGLPSDGNLRVLPKCSQFQERWLRWLV